MGWFGAAAENLQPASPRFFTKVPLLEGSPWFHMKLQFPQGSTLKGGLQVPDKGSTQRSKGSDKVSTCSALLIQRALFLERYAYVQVLQVIAAVGVCGHWSNSGNTRGPQ